MARQPSLRSQLNQIRAWVRQGRTNAWIAHQLGITIDQVERFKREHDLDAAEQTTTTKAIDPLSIPVPDAPAGRPDDEDEDEDETTDDEQRQRSSPSRGGQRRGRRGGRGGRGSRSGGSRSDRGERDGETPTRQSRGKDGDRERSGRDDRAGSGEDRPKRSRGRRGGRRRGKIPTYEATFDHGEEGYGLWLDPAVVDNPVYLKHWSGKRAVEVQLDPDSITIRRAELPDKPGDN